MDQREICGKNNKQKQKPDMMPSVRFIVRTHGVNNSLFITLKHNTIEKKVYLKQQVIKNKRTDKQHKEMRFFGD